jgi:hypothetical protein
MRVYKWITISAAIAITAVEAMVFNHETVAATPDTGSVSTAALPSAAASNAQWLRREALASPAQGENP